MKRILFGISVLLILSFFFLGCATAPEEPAEQSKEPVTEPEPKEVSEPEKEPEKVVKTIYLLFKESSYFADGVLDEYTIFTYEEEGTNIISKNLYTDDDVLIETRKYINENGLLVKEEVYDGSEKLQTYHTFTYDSSGNLSSEETFDNEDVLQLKSTYEYDNAGKRIKWSIYSGNDALFSYTEYTWKNGLNTRADTYTPSGELDVYFEYEYNNSGNLIKGTQYEADGDIIDFKTYSYENGHLTEEVIHRDNGSVKRKVQYLNDDRGNPAEIIFLNAAEKVQERLTREYIQREIIEYIK